MFLATRVSPRWLYLHNRSNVCPAMLNRRAQNAPPEFMPHRYNVCNTPYCQALSRLVFVVNQLESAVNEDVIDWLKCESSLVDTMVDVRKL